MKNKYKYMLKDLQGQGFGESHVFKTLREVWEYLVYCFQCSGELDNPHKIKLNDLLELGDFELLEFNKGLK